MNNYCPSLDRLREGDRVSIKYTGDRTLHLFVNGYDQGTAIYNLPEVIIIITITKVCIILDIGFLILRILY